MSVWINVSERLPPDNKKVLLFTPVDGEIRVGWHIKPTLIYAKEWRIITGMNGHQTLIKQVTHWMELPEWPKEWK